MNYLVILAGILFLPFGYFKLSLWWTDREVKKVKKQIDDLEGEKVDLLKLMIQDYENRKEKKV
jgi:hypothetical protein